MKADRIDYYANQLRGIPMSDLGRKLREVLRDATNEAKAEENEAIIAAANALENIASTSSSTRIRRVANDALTAIRARRNHG